MNEFDNKYRSQGYRLLGGIDEAGRGPLAGPVAAACVVLPVNCKIDGLRDSKQLSQPQRQELEIQIKQVALDWSVVFCPAKLIDLVNVLEATKIAMTAAYQALRVKPDLLLIDAVKIKYLPVTHYGIIKGDTKSASIAAASILAKQARDRYMEHLHMRHPIYGFNKHKGYPTKEHYDILKEFGPCEEHRLTFKGVS